MKAKTETVDRTDKRLKSPRCLVIALFIATVFTSTVAIRQIVPAIGRAKEIAEVKKEAAETAKEALRRTKETAAMIAAPGQRQLEQQLQDWLNAEKDIRQAGLRCVSVNLRRDISDGYQGLATFDTGEQVHVVVGRKADSDKLYFKADLPAVAVVLLGVLPGYEYTTIGKAFNTFFADPNWTTKIADNDAKFVEFTGRLKEDLLLIEKNEGLLGVLQGETPSWAWEKADKIYIRFALSRDGETFNLWSVQREEDQPMRANDWEKRAVLDKLFEAIYELK